MTLYATTSNLTYRESHNPTRVLTKTARNESIKTIIDEMEMPEVKYFVEKFMPAYMLTLDETR